MIPTTPAGLSKLLNFFDAAVEQFELPRSPHVEPARDPLAPPPVQVYDLEARIVDDGTLDTVVEFSCNICEERFVERFNPETAEDRDEMIDGFLPEIADEHGCYRDQS